MRVFIGDKEYDLNGSDVAKARNAVNTLMVTAKNASIETNNPALYWTVVLMMYKKATALLDGVGLENLGDVLKLHNVE